LSLPKRYPHVFRPITVGSLTLKNRIQFSPIVSRHADPYTGTCTNDLVEFLGAQARSGAALVTIGSSPIDFDRARDFYGCLSVVRESDVASLSVLAEEVHRYGAKLSIELTHAGAVSDPALLAGPAFAPSVIPGIHNPSTTKEIDRVEMDEVKQHWVDCVRRVKRAGFDMAMIHGAHMNLFASFLTPLLNRRTDDYGGNPENRMRFPLEVLEACRREAGRDFGLELRISGDERVPGGVSLEERIAFINAAAPYIDMVIVSTGGFLFPETAAYMMAGYHFPHMLNVQTAAEIKKNVGLPVSVVGGITTIDEAEQILAAGKADIVAMAKALIADQDLVTKAKAGKAADIRPCLRCLECAYGGLIGTPLRCAVNPQAGREVKYREIPVARRKKRVLVIGGGPAGMTAARVASERGHDVTLWERSERLGGRLFEAAALPQKDTARAYIEWAVRSTMDCGATIVLGKEATPAAVEAEAPDAIIVAIGAEFARPQIDGIDLPHVMTVSEADLGAKPVGETVVVCGGGLSGSECAAGLAMAGKKVTVVDVLPEDALCQDAVDLVRVALFGLLKDQGVERVQGAVKAIASSGVVVTLPDGATAELPAETVVVAFGLRPNTAAIDPLLDVVAESYAVGDCRSVGKIFTANHDAYNVAVEV
jgi:2,4-dienoyl-CoA reductase-like NADH-dependent reductase (Old Yellow Enzyme family)/thioredoxin reductase